MRVRSCVSLSDNAGCVVGLLASRCIGAGLLEARRTRGLARARRGDPELINLHEMRSRPGRASSRRSAPISKSSETWRGNWSSPGTHSFAPVSRDRVTACIEGDEYFRLRLNVMVAAMRKQHPAMRGCVEKKTVLNQQRALPHDMIDQPLAFALFGRAHRGRIQHADQLALHAEDRRRATCQR